MFGGLNRILAAALIAGAAVTAALAGPSVALACNGGTSAVNVYKECPLPSGGGGGKSTSGHAGGGPSTSSGDGSGAISTPTVSSHAAKAIRHAGKDRRLLSSLVHHSAPAPLPRTSGSAGVANSPTALGSAFDLGSGPTALLVALAGAALLLLGAVGVHGWRRSHRA